jgi:hypothetical protein
LLVVLFFLALSPEWSILSLGRELAQSSFAIYIIQGFVILLAIAAVIFVFFSLPLFEAKKKKPGE